MLAVDVIFLGCPRCGGAVFQAEEVIEKGISFHKRCFTCKTCQKPLNDKLQVFVGFDQEIYCKICYPAITHTPLPMDPNIRNKVKAMENDPEACPRCLGKVYAAERILSKDKCFHKECFTCQSCNGILAVNTAHEFQGEVFCKKCYTDRTSDGRNQFMDRNSIQKVNSVANYIFVRKMVAVQNQITLTFCYLEQKCDDQKLFRYNDNFIKKVI